MYVEILVNFRAFPAVFVCRADQDSAAVVWPLGKTLRNLSCVMDFWCERWKTVEHGSEVPWLRCRWLLFVFLELSFAWRIYTLEAGNRCRAAQFNRVRLTNMKCLCSKLCMFGCDHTRPLSFTAFVWQIQFMSWANVLGQYVYRPISERIIQISHEQF